LPYVAAAYLLGVLIPGTFAMTAFIRMRAARLRLAELDRRRRTR
jgi:hypothetical protein